MKKKYTSAFKAAFPYTIPIFVGFWYPCLISLTIFAGSVEYLGKVLPAAVFGLLVIYCLKDVSFLESSHGIPELIAIAAVIVLHCWKRQMLLSIAGGTVCYMLLVQMVF